MPIFSFRSGKAAVSESNAVSELLNGCSIEVMPRTAAKVPDLIPHLPKGTRVYIAHIQGTEIDDMVATARRISDQGFAVMPHLPARIILDADELNTWLARYASEAGVHEALVLGGGPATPSGTFDSSMQLLESGLFERHGFDRLHVAGHPEGNRDIDPDGSSRVIDAALRWKQDFRNRSDAEMGIVTQFAFDAAPVLNWADRLAQTGIDIPIHVGVAGPAKLQSLMKYAIACGVGPSLSVLQKRARDLTRLMRPFEPTEVLASLARGRSLGRGANIASVHLFPLGGILATTEYLATFRPNGSEIVRH